MTAHEHARIPKAVLAEIIELAYGANMGPKIIARMTSYHASYIASFGRAHGLFYPRGRHAKPTTVPSRLAALVMQWGPK